MGHTQSHSSYTSRPAVNTITRDPGLGTESSIADATSVRVPARLPPCWLSRSCNSRREPDDARCPCADESEEALNSSFLAELVTPLLTEGSHSDFVIDTLARPRQLFSCRGNLVFSCTGTVFEASTTLRGSYGAQGPAATLGVSWQEQEDTTGSQSLPVAEEAQPLGICAELQHRICLALRRRSSSTSR